MPLAAWIGSQAIEVVTVIIVVTISSMTVTIGVGLGTMGKVVAAVGLTFMLSTLVE